MHENNFNLVYVSDEKQTCDNIGFIHTIVYECVEKMNGDDYDYDDCIELLFKQWKLVIGNGDEKSPLFF